MSNAAPSSSIGRIMQRVMSWSAALTVAAAAAATAAFAVHILYQRAAAAEGATPSPPLPVEVTKVVTQPSYKVVERFAGRIETAQETDLAFERGGLVTEIVVEEGDSARKGQIVARLDARSLIAERDRLAAEKVRIETELALAERTRERQQNLSNKGFASEQRFDEAQASETALKAQIASIEAQLRQRDIDIEKSSLTAPFNGLIAERFLDPGAVTSAGRAVARLLEIGAPRARIGLPPEQAAVLRIGDTYALDVRGQKAEGRLLALRPDLAPGTRTVAALFDLSRSVALGAGGAGGESGKVAAPAGEIVRLSLEREVSAKGIWLPLAAMREGTKGLWSVYTVVEDTAENGEKTWKIGLEAVEALRVRGQIAYVRGSLENGVLVVISGSNRIAKGQIVRPLKPRAIDPEADEIGALAAPSRFAAR